MPAAGLVDDRLLREAAGSEAAVCGGKDAVQLLLGELDGGEHAVLWKRCLLGSIAVCGDSVLLCAACTDLASSSLPLRSLC